MLLLSFVSKGQTVMASETPKWCIIQGVSSKRGVEPVETSETSKLALSSRLPPG